MVSLPQFRMALLALSVVLAGCGGDSSNIGVLTDTDATANEIDESARLGSTVGVTVNAGRLLQRGPVSFSLPDSADGRFSIGATSGIVTLTGPVDYETSASHSILAKAQTANGGHISDQRFKIAVADSPAPEVNIDFPFAHANYSLSDIGLTVGVTHPRLQDIDVVANAGGEEVTGTVMPDGRFLLDAMDIPPGGDAFTIHVTASHGGGETVTESVTLSKRPDLTSVTSLALDPGANRLLMADRNSASILALSLTTLGLELVSGPGKGQGPLLENPRDLDLDGQTGDIYVLDRELRAVFRVAAGGDRSMVADDSIGAGDNLRGPSGMVFDPARGGPLVWDDITNRLYDVDPVTGDRTVISSNTTGTGPPIYFYWGMTLDAARDRVLVTETQQVFAIDLATGARAVLSPYDTEPEIFSRHFSGISAGTTSSISYLTDIFNNAVVKMDAFSGRRRSVSSSGLNDPENPVYHPVIGTGPPLEAPADVVFDEIRNRVFIVEGWYGNPVIEVDPDNGDRTVLADGSVGSGIHLRGVRGISLDSEHQVAYVVDGVADIVMAIDLETGDRQLIAGDANGRGTINAFPIGVAHDPVSGDVYVADFTLDSLSIIDRDTGTTRVISDDGIGSGPPFENPYDLELNLAAGVAYVLDNLAYAVYSVDLTNGTRQIVSSPVIGTGPPFGDPRGLDLDAENSRLFVSDAAPGTSDCIYSVDLPSGDRSVVSCNSVGLGQGFSNLSDLAWDRVNVRVLALDDVRNALFSVDATTGNREIISGDNSLLLRVIDPDTGFYEYVDVPRVAGGGPPLRRPRSIDFDPERQIAYITDDAYKGVIAVDVVSGYRQLISH